MASQGAKMLLALLALMITGSLQKDASGPWKHLDFEIIADEGADALFTCTTSDPEMANVSLVRTGKGAVPPDAMSFNYTKGITLYKVRPDQSGEYVCEGVIGGVKEESDPFELLVREIVDPPTVTLDHQGHVRILGEEFQITCTAKSFASISVTWNHNSTHATITKKTEIIGKMWIYTFTLTIPRVETADSGNYTCKAENWRGTSVKRTILQVLDRGYLHLTILENRDQRMTLESDLKLQVLIESYPKVLHWRWTHQSTEEVDKSNLGDLQDLSNERYKSTLTLYRPKPTEAGIYTFFAANSEANSSITFALHNLYSVAASMYPLSEPKELQCQASGYPAPDISWYWCPGRNVSCEEKEMLPLEGASTNVSFGQSYSTLRLKEISQTATYVCKASNVVGFQLDFVTTPFADRIINREVPNKLFSPVLAAFGGVAALFLLLLILLFYKYKQKPKYETRWQIIEACEGNNYIFIDPTQLPYNEKLEFPRSNLTFGKTLGAGAFGKVLEATAHGLGKEDSSVKVAVKMLKQSAHTEEKEALMSELKIMSHLGQHNNIVNLLGACTHGGPILVITEYCQHGDLLNFLRKKGESFVIKAPATEMLTEGNVIYKNLCVDKKYTRSDSGFSSQCRESYVEMRPVRSDSTSKGSVSAEGDDEEDTRPLMLQDLLHFSGQVAQGMAFLASKNCIHRDVAARNVLVTHGRVAKICDFGLARDIMNDSNYVVKGNARLPVKWMAPESIFDCIYTMQSDVWSYGILLWEIFSLGMSPYPGILVDGKFYKLVKQGYHMAQPDFAPLEIYEIMKACWDLEPTRRPTFQHISDFIQHLIGSSHDQNTNLPCNAAPDEDSGCDLSSCDKGSCEQGEAGHPLMKGNNYQFC